MADTHFAGSCRLVGYYIPQPDGLRCDQPRALNVSRSDGSYTLTAESNLGYYWEGIINFVQGTCDKVELQLSKKGISGSQVVYLAQPSSAGSGQK